jgi:hypothetical protein
MILLYKTGRNEAVLRLDMDGGRQLLALLTGLQDGTKTAFEVIAGVDDSLLGKRGHRIRQYPLSLAKQHAAASEGSLALEDDHVVWRLVEREHEIEYAMERLEDASRSGSFTPAEFLMVRAPKSEHLVQIFGEVVRTSYSRRP